MDAAARKRTKRCRSSSSSSVAIPVLPIDIIETEILLRLPVKSLLRLKSVCKLWYSIIKNPSFIRNHYNHQTNRTVPIFAENVSCSGDQMPIVVNPAAAAGYGVWPMANFNGLCRQGDQENGGGGNLLFSHYLGVPLRSIFIRPVNGFILIVHPNESMNRCRMAMFNPATRQFRKLSNLKFNTLAPPEESRRLLPDNHLFGFGICKYVYKVVWLNRHPDSREVSVAKVYTVGREGKGWRLIDKDLPKRFARAYTNYPAKNISKNGKCYWLSRDFSSVLVFDFDAEVFREMNSPIPSAYHSTDPSYNRRFKNAMFSEVRCCGDEGDSVALFLFESNSVRISVLDGEEDWRWTHRVVACSDRPLGDLFNPLQLFQFPITDSAIILKAGYNSFALYNPKTNECVRFSSQSPREAGRGNFVCVFNSKESLFSVDGGIQVSDHVLRKFYAFKEA